MNSKEIHNLFLKCQSLSIDTRKIAPNSMFFAIKGDNFDANTFAKEALDRGALYVIIDNNDYYVDERTILVNNSLKALQDLAKYHRDYLRLPIIALTGSNGKTTTKELINVVLSKKFNTKATIGNLNNHIGVPLTLLSFDSTTEIGIVEMGANHQKEIEFLCQLATPDFGYITNFGKAHLEGFGGVEGVIKGKSEMYHYLLKNDKVAFVNLEDPIQLEKTKSLQRFTFGVQKSNADVSITSISASPFVAIEYDNKTIQSNLIGSYNANNINAAIAIGAYFKVGHKEIKQALESYVPDNNRSQLISVGSNQIILDAYNANPSSMAVAISNFMQLESSPKLMVLGDMFELGDESDEEHLVVVNSVRAQSDVICYFVGKAFYKHSFQSNQVLFFESFDTFSEFLVGQNVSDTMILIKGSRGMALERTVPLLK